MTAENAPPRSHYTVRKICTRISNHNLINMLSQAIRGTVNFQIAATGLVAADLATSRKANEKESKFIIVSNHSLNDAVSACFD